MKQSSSVYAASILTLALISSRAVSQDSASNYSPAAKLSAKSQPPAQRQDEGQRVFEQNCSRCHAAPDGFSPSISGTVARHMRVRASLSRADEEALIHFLNP